MSSNPSLDSEWGSGGCGGRVSQTEWDRLMAEKFGWTEAKIQDMKRRAARRLEEISRRAEAYVQSRLGR